MSLRDLITADAGTVFLRTDDFAESCTFLPKTGGERPVIASCEQETKLIELDGETKLIDELWVHCLRDKDHATYGGIDRPEIGDQLLRGATADPEQRPYGFTGDIEHTDAASWDLRFERAALHRVGREHVQK